MMGSQVKKYKNKNLGDFYSIPISMVNESSILDSLYLASHFKKLATTPVATVRTSKHYASTLAAWEKKLTGVDTTDIAEVAKTLGHNVEVFDPFASSQPRTLFSGGGRSKRTAHLLKVKTGVDTTDIAEVAKTLGHNVEVFDPFASSPPRTLFSGGGRSKRTAQLLKVKRGVFKPMKAGAILDELPPDIMRDVVGRLDPKDNSSLINVSRGVREDTLAAMPAQERLWHATKLLNLDHVEAALKEGARVNKIDPSSGMNAPKMAFILLDKDIDRTVAVHDLLLQKGGNPLNMKEINKHLIRCVKGITGLPKYHDDDELSDGDDNSDSDDDTKPWRSYLDLGLDYLDGIPDARITAARNYRRKYYDGSPFSMLKEALLDGADANTRTKYRVKDELILNIRNTKSGGLLHLLTLRVNNGEPNIQTRVDTINILKSFGIDMNQVDYCDEEASEHTALRYACSVDRYEDRDRIGDPYRIRPAIAKALLECGIDVNKKDSRGETVLHDLAKETRYKERWVLPGSLPDAELLEDASLARLVLSFGADVSITNNSGDAVMDYIEYFDDDDSYEGLEYDPVMRDVWIRATEAREDFIEAVKSGDLESVKQFLEQGAPVNTIVQDPGSLNGKFDTLLHLAIGRFHANDLPATDNLAIVRLLLAEPGFDVNAVDWMGNTAIMVALGSHGDDMMAPWRVEVIKMLLAEPGIDLNIKSIFDKDIWDILMHGDGHSSRRHDNEEIIKLVAQAKGIPYESRSRMTRSRDESEYESDIDRSVRQRVGGRRRGSLASSIQSQSSRYGKERTNDAALAQAITVLFSQMNMNMKYELLKALYK